MIDETSSGMSIIWARMVCLLGSRGAGENYPARKSVSIYNRARAQSDTTAMSVRKLLNLTGTFLVTQAVGKRSMIPNRYGRIINVASIAGLRGNPVDMLETLAYNTTKGGLVNFTRALAAEWGEHGITVNAIAPGFFPSKMTQASLERLGEKIVARTPLRRLGDAEDLKGLAVLLASDASRHITGQVIAVDGGTSVA